MNTVNHQIESNRFVLAKDGYECLLDYKLSGRESSQSDTHQKIDFNRTYVPTELRGQKLAEQLVVAGLAWAKEQDYDIEASCSYVKKFL
ncbi:conserved hypothetical protein [Oleispira antarctica RB-8]|uniref:N-acetyltransferase domain-containing protein n=1 Tax=Oleispira antarctica RB-8 TaxID=698738 RepID=R4YRT3_OLEAN|nr:conserved hypothetical protein [Oleispira antarctica RB-8]